MHVLAEAWDLNGDGAIDGIETMLVILVAIAAAMVALGTIGLVTWKVLGRFSKSYQSVAHFIHRVTTALDIIHGTPDEFDDEGKLVSPATQGLPDQFDEIKAHMAETCEIDQKRWVKVEAIGKQLDQVQDLVDHELNTNKGTSMKDHVTYTMEKVEQVSDDLLLHRQLEHTAKPIKKAPAKKTAAKKASAPRKRVS